jgi:hypothetical protein
MLHSMKRPAGASGYESFETPQRPSFPDGLVKIFEQLKHDSHIELPFREKESPNKRRKSPGHDSVWHINELYWKDSAALTRALEAFKINTPSRLEAHDSRLIRLCDTLRNAVDRARQTRTPKTDPSKPSWLSQKKAPRGRSPSPPPSPTQQIKHLPADAVIPPIRAATHDGSPVKARQSDLNDLMDDAVPADLDHPVLAASASKATSSLFDLAGLKSAETSSNSRTKSANTSFWSAPPNSQLPPASPATTVDDMDEKEDFADEATQTTNYGEFPSSAVPGHSPQTDSPATLYHTPRKPYTRELGRVENALFAGTWFTRARAAWDLLRGSFVVN